jgi:hypothetical protein
MVLKSLGEMSGLRYVVGVTLRGIGEPRNREREFRFSDGPLKRGVVKTKHGHWSGIGGLSELA